MSFPVSAGRGSSRLHPGQCVWREDRSQMERACSHLWSHHPVWGRLNRLSQCSQYNTYTTTFVNLSTREWENDSKMPRPLLWIYTQQTYHSILVLLALYVCLKECICMLWKKRDCKETNWRIFLLEERNAILKKNLHYRNHGPLPNTERGKGSWPRHLSLVFRISSDQLPVL